MKRRVIFRSVILAGLLFVLGSLPITVAQAMGQADWRQWDSFLTFVVKHFGQDIGGELRNSLCDVLLDGRYEMVQAISPAAGAKDPVPGLFLNSWKRLSPVLNQALPGLSQQTAGRYRSFIKAADGLAAIGEVGFQLGIKKLSPDVLRGMARLLEPTGTVDPVAYSLNIDPQLRTLLGLGPPLSAPRPSSAVKEGRIYHPPLFYGAKSSIQSRSWFISLASAAEPGVIDLNQSVPDEQNLQAYLSQVRDLLKELSDKVLVKSKLAEKHRKLYREIVLAAAWQESCWRQFVRKGEQLAPLTSATGDVGLMQVNRNVWRGLYDIKGLTSDIQYNGQSGGEILYYYLTKYAIRKEEDKQSGGHLARATYAAYNGGPGHLTRYRSPKPNPALKKVDDLFWEKYQAVSSGRELDVLRCYRK
jgi:soluble lytic murein transglycosylase-like protein